MIYDENHKTGDNFSVHEKELDISVFLRSFWFYKVSFFLTVATCCLVGFFVFLSIEKVYTAAATIQLEESRSSASLADELSGIGGSEPKVNTEIAIIMSRLVATEAAKYSRINQSIKARRVPLIGNMLANYDMSFLTNYFDKKYLLKYETYGASLAYSVLRVPEKWVGIPMTLISLGSGQYEVSLPDNRKLIGQVGISLEDTQSNFGILLSNLNAAIGKEYIVLEIPETHAALGLLANLSVKERSKKSLVLNLFYSASTVERAELVLNSVTRAYISQNIDRSAAEAQKSLEFVIGQIPIARNKVELAQTALNNFRTISGSVDLDVESESLLIEISQFDQRLVQLNGEGDVLLKKYTVAHPIYTEWQSKKDTILKRLIVLKSRVEELPLIQQEIINFTLELELATEIYLQLLTRAQEIEVDRARTIGSVRLIDGALSNSYPVAPKIFTILLVSIILGTMLASIYITFRHFSKAGITGAEEIEALGLPVFATVLQASQKQNNKNAYLNLLSLEDPECVTMEAVRSLRTALHFGMMDNERKSIAIISASPGVGKSFIASNLAVVSAQAGQRVILIDCDMRRGVIHKYFKQKRKSVGLSDYLSKDLDINEIVNSTEVENLQVICSGDIPPNPAELLLKDRMKDLVLKLEKDFDLVILDCPPVLAVTDPVILSRYAGMRLMITRFNLTNPGQVMAVKQALQIAGVGIEGAIFNGLDPKSISKGSAYNYAYNYRYSYKN